MQERQLTLGVVCFPYGGSGGTSAEVPCLRQWQSRVVLQAMADKRISPNVWLKDFSDTPITMTRNRAVKEARAAGVDVLIMVDSDMKPDCEKGSPEFFPTSFDFLHKHYDKGPSVICAPYCGPPPDECVYVFRWHQHGNNKNDLYWKLEMYGREEAALMKGIQSCAAQPTGLIMFDMRAFDLTDPQKTYDALLKKGKSVGEAQRLAQGWFYYEWGDVHASEKASTEDVTATRDISMAGILELGYSPIYCNWDCWAGHWKPKCVTKPQIIYADQVNEKYREAVMRSVNMGERIVNLEVPPELRKRQPPDEGTAVPLAP